MSDQTKSRFAVDLDDLERQLRQTAGTQPRMASSDPLADLSRLVGQNDPFKDMFADKKPVPPPVQVASPAPRRVEPSLDDLLRDLNPNTAAPRPVPPAAPPQAAPPKDMLDEFDRLLQGELRGTTAPVPHNEPRVVQPEAYPEADAMTGQRADSPHDLDTLAGPNGFRQAAGPDAGMAAPPAEYPEPPADEQPDMRSLEPQQPRKGLVIAGLLLGVAALGIGAVVGIRGLSGPVKMSGDPPVIKAEAGPAKVAPQNPGGVEIPNQNKQIFERTPEPRAADTRVVVREEQPMDVQASARAAARVILPGTGVVAPATQTPAVTAALPAGPQGSAVAPANGANGSPEAQSSVASQPPALGEPRRVRTIAVRPDGTIAPPPGTQVSGAAISPPATPPAAAATPVRVAPAPAPRPAPRVVAAEEAPAPRPAPQRTQVAAAPPAEAAPRSAEPAGSGGFMVQLGAPGSEAEARSSFTSLQRRFTAQLSGESPTIRKADVGNGKTVYRLRVGPYSREDAAEKCEALKAAGGNCFIARN